MNNRALMAEGLYRHLPATCGARDIAIWINRYVPGVLAEVYDNRLRVVPVKGGWPADYVWDIYLASTHSRAVVKDYLRNELSRRGLKPG